MDFKELAEKRYSVRKFSSKEIESEKLNKILQIGNLAPTAKNQQPQRIYVIKSDAGIKKLRELTSCVYGASTVLLFTYNTDEEWQNPLEDGVHSGVEDVSITATYIMLAAEEQGLGTCYCNYFSNSLIEREFNIPKNEKSVILMPIGYKAKDSEPSSRHEESKALDEIVKYI